MFENDAAIQFRQNGSIWTYIRKYRFENVLKPVVKLSITRIEDIRQSLRILDDTFFCFFISFLVIIMVTRLKLRSRRNVSHTTGYLNLLMLTLFPQKGTRKTRKASRWHYFDKL